MQKFKVNHSLAAIQLHNGELVCPKASYLNARGIAEYHLVELCSDDRIVLYNNRGKLVDKWPKDICLQLADAIR